MTDGLLDRLTTAPTRELWDQLWDALYHQGVSAESLAALPWLAETAQSPDREQATNAVTLASVLIVSSKGTHAGLLAAANRLLPGSSDAEYPYLLECVLAFEGVAYWADDLAWAVAGEEQDVACPGCGTDLLIYDEVCSAAEGEPRPVVPANPARLEGIGKRLHDTAAGHGRERIAEAFLLLFGQATCPACGAGFTVADHVL